MEVYQKRFFTGKFKTKMDDLGGSFTGDSSVWLNWYEMICMYHTRWEISRDVGGHWEQNRR